jgi:phage-related minor tail protein
MTEERKVQLGVAVDATGAKAGFDQIKQDAQSMAQAVGQAGQTAGKGLDAIGDGAKRAADGMNREEGRMRASIQRATLDLKTLGKSASEKLEAKISLQGLDPAKFQPYLAALKQAEAEQQKLQASAAATTNHMGEQAQRLTWNQFTGQRMGPVMKEFSAQGVPHAEAHTQAIRQIAAEWQQYKATGVGAQAAVAAQAGATTTAVLGVGRAIQQASGKGIPGTGLSAMAAEADHAKTSFLDLSRVTTSLGATSFTSLDKVTTSLGATAAKANEATSEIHRLAAETARLGALPNVGTSLGAAVGPAVPAGSLREALTRQPSAREQADRSTLAQRLSATQAAGANAAVGAELDAIAAKQGAVTGALGATTKAFAGTNKTARELQFALRGLPAQFTDIAVSLASGQRPMMVLLQQGGQIKDMFGGIGPAARAMGGYIVGLVNPFTVAAAAVGVYAIALAHAESAARGLNTLQAQPAGTGRSGMFSTDELKDFLKEIQLAPGVTRDVASSIVSELSKARNIGGDLFRDLGKSAADYAKATGTDIPTAAKALANAFEDPEKGAKQLEEALGTLTSTQLLAIERLSKSGDIAGAQRVLFDALQRSVKGLADNAMTPLQKSTNDLGNSWEGAMRKMDQSDGLRNLNTLLGQAVKAVQFLVDNADKVGGLGNIGVSMIPGVGAPAAAANVVLAAGNSAARSLFGDAPKNPVASGKVTDLTGSASAGAAGTNKVDDEIKRALEAAKSYRSQAGELADLANERKRFNSALTESIALYGKESEQAKRLRAAVAGVDEKMAAVRKRGQGGGNEAQQVLDAQLRQSLKASKDILDQERDNIAFSQRFLQGVFQAGELSLKDFYEEKRKAIAAGVSAELAELEKERVAVQAHLEATKKTSPKDTSAIVNDQTRLKEIDAQAGKLRTDGARQQVLANQEESSSFKQLSEQVLNYRANLLQLQGDEVGAAKIRAQIAIEQASVLSKQFPGVDVAGLKAAQDQQIALNEAKTKTSQINQILQIEEDRIGLSVRTGAAGEIEALNQLGAVRAKAVTELEKIVQAQEEVAKSRPQDYQLQIDTSRARLELEKLKGELDPLKDKFDNLFKDAGATLFSDLGSGKGVKGALTGFVNSIGAEMNKIAGREVSQMVFGKGGPLGGAGGMFADLVGGKDRTKPALDTSAVTASLSNMQAAGLDPATAALGRFQAAVDAAAATALGNRSMPAGIALPPVADGTGSTGDFARFDRTNTTGENSVLSLFKDADKSGAKLADTNAVAASSMLRFAQAASRGQGALAQLPSVIQAIIAAASSSGGGGGGGFLGSIFSLFGSSGGGGVGSALPGLSGAVDGVPYLFARGGYTGDVDVRKPAGVVHGKEYVFSAPAVRAIGVERLERMHRKAKSGQMDDETPGYSDGGYVAVLGSVRPQARSWRDTEGTVAAAGNVYNTIHVTATPGMSREQAMNQGRDIQRGMQAGMVRRRRNV